MLKKHLREQRNQTPHQCPEGLFAPTLHIIKPKQQLSFTSIFGLGLYGNHKPSLSRTFNSKGRLPAGQAGSREFLVPLFDKYSIVFFQAFMNALHFCGKKELELARSRGPESLERNCLIKF
jgi:hypothetical protein